MPLSLKQTGAKDVKVKKGKMILKKHHLNSVIFLVTALIDGEYGTDLTVRNPDAPFEPAEGFTVTIKKDSADDQIIRGVKAGELANGVTCTFKPTGKVYNGTPVLLLADPDELESIRPFPGDDALSAIRAEGEAKAAAKEAAQAKGNEPEKDFPF